MIEFFFYAGLAFFKKNQAESRHKAQSALIEERLLKAGYHDVAFLEVSYWSIGSYAYRVRYADSANKIYEDEVCVLFDRRGRPQRVFWRSEHVPPYADLFEAHTFNQDLLTPLTQPTDIELMEDDLSASVKRLKQQGKL